MDEICHAYQEMMTLIDALIIATGVGCGILLVTLLPKFFRKQFWFRSLIMLCAVILVAGRISTWLVHRCRTEGAGPIYSLVSESISIGALILGATILSYVRPKLFPRRRNINPLVGEP